MKIDQNHSSRHQNNTINEKVSRKSPYKDINKKSPYNELDKKSPYNDLDKKSPYNDLTKKSSYNNFNKKENSSVIETRTPMKPQEKDTKIIECSDYILKSGSNILNESLIKKKASFMSNDSIRLDEPQETLDDLAESQELQYKIRNLQQESSWLTNKTVMLNKMLKNIELDEKKIDSENKATIKDKENILVRIRHDHNEILSAFEQQIRKEQDLLKSQYNDIEEMSKIQLNASIY